MLGEGDWLALIQMRKFRQTKQNYHVGTRIHSAPDRVEALRGPQRTQFGAGAEGGVVRFIAPEPNLHAQSAYVRGDHRHALFRSRCAATHDGPDRCLSEYRRVAAQQLKSGLPRRHRRKPGSIEGAQHRRAAAKGAFTSPSPPGGDRSRNQRRGHDPLTPAPGCGGSPDRSYETAPPLPF